VANPTTILQNELNNDAKLSVYVNCEDQTKNYEQNNNKAT